MLWKIIYKELLFRKLELFLTLLAVISGVALFTIFFTLTSASNRETIRLTRNMGFNLSIIPKETDMPDYWHTGYSDKFMPEDYVNKFRKYKNFSFAHVTATLHKRLKINNIDIIVTGISKEIEPSGKKKSPMIFSIDKNYIIIGHEVAKIFNKRKNDFISIKNQQFKISQVLTETGRSDDIRIYGDLHEMQILLDLDGKINEIKALQCLCLVNEDQDLLEIIRGQLKQVLPDGKVILDKIIADAREQQRQMIEKYFLFLTPIVLIGIGLWIFTFAWLNIKERKKELGVFHSLGFSSLRMIFVFLFRAFIIGLIGAIFGFFIGTYISLLKGPMIFKVTAGSIKPIYSIFIWALFVTPIFAIVSSLIPIMINVMKDPAEILQD